MYARKVRLKAPLLDILISMKKISMEILADFASRYGAEGESLSFLGGYQYWSDGTVYRYSGAEGERAPRYHGYLREGRGRLARRDTIASRRWMPRAR